VEPAAYLDAIRRDADGLVAALRRGLTPSVPGCPDWTVADLARHMGMVHRWSAGIVASRPDRGAVEQLEAPDDAALADWVAEGADALIATLSAADPTDDCWTFDANNRTVSFWHRRQGNETSVHRWDAEAAHDGVDGAPALDADIAADGVDEFLTAMLPGVRKRMSDPVVGAGETFHLHRTDGPGEWFVVFPADGSVVVTAEHAKGDVAMRGSASDLVLWLWRRVPDDRLDLAGDETRIDRWRELVPAR
jgi:uncharacterized protein (TIGR03083 family)